MSGIDWLRRPAKYVQREIILSQVHKLGHFATLEDYQYIGCGGLYFSDFVLMHERFNLTKLISIERDTNSQARYKFNRPLACIDIQFGTVSQVLADLSLDGPSIIWLDLQSQIDKSVLHACEWIGRQLGRGGLLLLTVNAHCKQVERLDVLQRNLASRLRPDDEAALAADAPLPVSGVDAFAMVQQHSLHDLFGEVKRLRGDKCRLRQVFNFVYSDDARMQTLGWVVTAKDDDTWLEDFRASPYARSGHDPYLLDVPTLTRREFDQLQALMPRSSSKGSNSRPTWMPKEDYERFSEIYRWYPTWFAA